MRFLTAKDVRGDGEVWTGVLKQADGVVFVGDGSAGQVLIPHRPRVTFA